MGRHDLGPHNHAESCPTRRRSVPHSQRGARLGRRVVPLVRRAARGRAREPPSGGTLKLECLDSVYDRFAPSNAGHSDADDAWTRAPKRQAPRQSQAGGDRAHSHIPCGPLPEPSPPRRKSCSWTQSRTEYVPALALLRRRAEGDFSEDKRPLRFPKVTGQRLRAEAGLGCWGVFEAWVRERRPAPFDREPLAVRVPGARRALQGQRHRVAHERRGDQVEGVARHRREIGHSRERHLATSCTDRVCLGVVEQADPRKSLRGRVHRDCRESRAAKRT